MADTEVARSRHVLELDDRRPGVAGLRVAGDVFLPHDHHGAPVLCCLAGGGMSRGYWDLRPDGDESYSFALHAARAGFPVITLDHLGTGGSDLPPGVPPPTLTQVVEANDAAFGHLVDAVRAHLALPGRPRKVGVGHSMGAMLTIRQHAAFPRYSALALLGFTTAGLPDQVPKPILDAAAGIPDDRTLARLTESMFGSAYPRAGARNRRPHPATEPSPLGRAVAECGTVLLGAGGMLSLLPGNVAREARRARVPVFLGNGAHDRLVASRAGAHEFPQARSVDEFVLADSGHSHNTAPDRELLWLALEAWAVRVAPPHR